MYPKSLQPGASAHTYPIATPLDKLTCFSTLYKITFIVSKIKHITSIDNMRIDVREKPHIFFFFKLLKNKKILVISDES